MTPGQQIRIKPGLRDKPAISGRDGVVVEVINDRIRVKVGSNQWLVDKSDVQK
jgi:membrane protein implicated in regulation of membrane protease activity